MSQPPTEVFYMPVLVPWSSRISTPLQPNKLHRFLSSRGKQVGAQSTWSHVGHPPGEPGPTPHVPAVSKAGRKTRVPASGPVPLPESHRPRSGLVGEARNRPCPAIPQSSWRRVLGPHSVPSSAHFKDVAIFWAKATISHHPCRALCPCPSRALRVTDDSCPSRAPSGSDM